MTSQDPNVEFSVQKKAENKFGTFPYELKPTQNYLYTLYRFYQAEAELCNDFKDTRVNDIKTLGDMIGFQNYHTCRQSQTFIKDWMKNQFDLSEKDFDSAFQTWCLEDHPDANSKDEIQKIRLESVSAVNLNEENVNQKIKKVFDHFLELRQVPEEWIEEPAHPVRFLQHRLECHNQFKKLVKSLTKTNHPLASTFPSSLYGSYLYLLEDSFPVELKKPYLNLCIIYAFENDIK
jgi:hypothetical protein